MGELEETTEAKQEACWPVGFQQSDEIGELASALAKAQAKIQGATADTKNTFFHSSYATLKSVINASRIALAEQGLTIVQMPTHYQVAGERMRLSLVTMLLHESGQWLRFEYQMPVAPDNKGLYGPQQIGSATTYARRYSWSAVAGIYQDDDDAEASQGRTLPPKAKGRPAKAGKQDTLEKLHQQAEKEIMGAKSVEDLEKIQRKYQAIEWGAERADDLDNWAKAKRNHLLPTNDNDDGVPF